MVQAGYVSKRRKLSVGQRRSPLAGTEAHPGLSHVDIISDLEGSRFGEETVAEVKLEESSKKSEDKIWKQQV